MPAYNYTAVDKEGKNRRGVIAADSQRDARKKLQAQALFPVTINLGRDDQATGFLSGLSDKFQLSARLKTKDQTMITRQLATLVGAGTPIEEALRAIAAQSEKLLIRHLLTRLHADVSEGRKLSQALYSEKRHFSGLYISMVAAGEASGRLGDILNRIADYLEKSEEVRNTVRTALIYPAVLSVVASAVLILLMTFVVPKVVSQFDSFNAELPMITKIVMHVSTFLGSYGGWLLMIVLAMILTVKMVMRSPSVRLIIHGGMLRLPVIGKLIRSVSSARFARTLGTLLEGGSPMLEAILAAKETVANQVIRAAIDQVYKDVREGRSLSAALKQQNSKALGQDLFMPLLVYMTAAGEKSGTLADLLVKVADYLEQEFDGFTKVALSLLEPMIVIIMGVMVGVIVMAIMLPIMRLNSLVLL